MDDILERLDSSLELIDQLTPEQRRSLGAVTYVIEANIEHVRDKLLEKSVQEWVTEYNFTPEMCKYLKKLKEETNDQSR